MPEKKKTMVDPLGNEFELQFKEVGMERHEHGTILLPMKMTLPEAVYWLLQKHQSETQQVKVQERVEGFPIDVCYALQRATQEMFGFSQLLSEWSFWEGEKKPTFKSVKIDEHGNTTEIFVGKFTVPGIEGSFKSYFEANNAVIIEGTCRQMDVKVIKSLVNRTKELLKRESLYRGKAFRTRKTVETWGEQRIETLAEPEFMDLSKVSTDLILNHNTLGLVERTLWTPIQRTQQLRELGMKVKRGILLHGMYGTGKSLTAQKTATICKQHGWTFIYGTNVRDIKDLYQFAARYSPAVLFAEDIDLVVKHADDDDQEGYDQDGINTLNNVLDGIDSKNNEIILVLTTNHIDRLPESMIRPGRFDAIIEYTAPDAETAAKLVEMYAQGNIDHDNFDAATVGRVLAGQIPAMIHEVVKRAYLMAVTTTAENYRGPLSLSTRDITLAAESMKNHVELMERLKDKTPPSAFEQIGRKALEGAVELLRDKQLV